MNVNENGLMDAASSAELCDRYGCRLTVTSDLFVNVHRFRDTHKSLPHRTESVTAVDTGLWRPPDLITACRTAKLQPVRAIDMATAKIQNPGGLHEPKIAKHLAAVGIRPYLVRKSKHLVAREGVPVDHGFAMEPRLRAYFDARIRLCFGARFGRRSALGSPSPHQ